MSVILLSANFTIPPSYKKFFECLHLLRHFQAVGQLKIGVRYIPSSQNPISKDEEGNERPNTIQISFPVNGEDSHRLADLLEGVKKSEGRYVLNMRQAYNESAEIGIMTRSLLSTMYYLSLGIDVPRRDINAGTVAMTKNSDGSLFDWREVVGDLFIVKTSPHYPQNAYLAVAYRGNWFYIDDSDVNSKRTFVLLQQIYNLQSRQQERDTPILSIPLGSPG